MISSDGKAMSTKTPRTDEASAILNRQSDYGLSGYVAADFARQLETGLQEANEQLEAMTGAFEFANKQLAEHVATLEIWKPQIQEAIMQVAASDELYRDMCRRKDAISKRAEAIRRELVETSKQLAESQAREAVLRDDVKPLVAWMLNHSPACDSDTIKTFLSKHPDMKP